MIGVNTFLVRRSSPTILPKEVIRSTEDEKEFQINTVASVQARHANDGAAALERLRQVALHNGNVFAELMETTKVCTFGEISHALFSVGGQYRRNM